MNKQFNLNDYKFDNMFTASDYHFNHFNCIKFDNRPYSDIKQMNEDLVNKHNSITNKDSLTFIIGDVAMGRDVSEVVNYLESMKGDKVLVKGNHDHNFLRDHKFRECFVMIDNYYSPDLNGTKVVMQHYPIYEWDKMHRGAIHLHGHIHTKQVPYADDCKILNVGIMNSGFVPRKMSDVFELMKNKPIREHHSN
jgi:calcineurin-like phosphoesterase family protein